MPHPTRQAIIRWAAGIALTLVVYPLSLGPIGAMGKAGLLPPVVVAFLVRVMYRPIYFVAEKSPAFRDLMNAYLGLWT